MLRHCVLCFCCWLAHAAELLVLNHGSDVVEMGGKSAGKTVAVGGSWMAKRSERKFGSGKTMKFSKPATTVTLPDDKFAVLVFEANEAKPKVFDANDLQIEISAAAEACQDQRGSPEWSTCLGNKAFGGGMPKKFAESAFQDLWVTYDFWHLCNVQTPDPPIRSIESRLGKTVEIIREKPLVAAVRQFLTPDQCSEIVGMTSLKDLVRAHEGAVGGTATTESRETLTTNLFVDWDKQNALSHFAANMFDFVSEQVGVNFSYEAQEPINFLHYLPGFEYRPHMDGSANGKGKRMATTLVYCTAAQKGGGTVFPSGTPLRFQPGDGDLMLFSYEVQPMLSLHAACPVLAGTKTTLTQWYRPDVSFEEPWDKFENWGQFHNPHSSSRWKGPRYGGKVEL
eukprot:TRINITY_DN93271_c0_g1_i1.p1 TRINITY_DN93271_c0_g1~~TRINITY_DN93271_c0_g1_i1.p1  ORF type:complete len:396 (-),score=34.43 TRINITY_DN93271_c0_g1_i1:101-1288(-)